jgi:hypothetical protein
VKKLISLLVSLFVATILLVPLTGCPESKKTDKDKAAPPAGEKDKDKKAP